MDNIDWKVIFKLNFKIIQEPYLQSFYKILHRILNCNEKLHTWKIKDNNKCAYCNGIDTIEHHIYTCKESNSFWEKLTEWMLNNLEISFTLTICEVLFGIPISNNVDIEIINFLISIGKWFINQMRTNEWPLYFINFLHIAKQKVEIIILNNKIHCLDNKEWQERLHCIV